MSQIAVRHRNATRILHAIRAMPGATQRDIVAMADADKSTVSTILRNFESLRLIERVERRHSGGRGRPSEGYVISSAGGLVVGVSLKPDEIRFVLADFAGEVRAVLARPIARDLADLGRAMATGINGLMISAGYAEAELRAVGISVPGLVHIDGTVRHSPNLKWSDFNPKHQLEAELDVPVFVGNDADGAALGELLLNNPPSERSFMLVMCGSGIGAGLVYAGELCRGAIGFAGEIGHHKIARRGRPCQCGARGCMDAYTSDVSLVAIAREAGLPIADFADILTLAKAADPRLDPLLDDYADAMAMGLVNAITITGLPDVVLSGGMGALYPLIADRLDGAFGELMHPRLKRDLAFSVAAEDSAERPMGGIAIALEGCTGLAGEHAPWAPHRIAAAADISTTGAAQ